MNGSRAWIRGILSIGFLLATTAAMPQSDERNRMSVPPTTIFKSMLRFASEHEAVKVARSIEFLAPVLAEHRAAFGAASVDALVQRINGSDPQASEQAIRALIAHDAIVLLRVVPGAPAYRTRGVVRAAAVEWRIVDESLADGDPARAAAARKVSAHFKDLLDAVTAEESTPPPSMMAKRVEREVTALFP